MPTASDVLVAAANEVGYDRYKDSKAGTKYGRWYAELIGSDYYGKNGVPYCAMFVSWVLYQVGVSCAGVPGAYTPTMLKQAQAAGAAVDKHNLQPGDLVYFDWDGGGVVDHVGFCVKVYGTYIETIEGNTSGGKVARRTRAYSVIKSGARPNYDRPSVEIMTGWYCGDEGWYWLGNDGRKHTGWQWISNDWYYFDSNGLMLSNGFYCLGELWYAFDRNGHLLGDGANDKLIINRGGSIVLP